MLRFVVLGCAALPQLFEQRCGQLLGERTPVLPFDVLHFAVLRFAVLPRLFPQKGGQPLGEKGAVLPKRCQNYVKMMQHFCVTL